MIILFFLSDHDTASSLEVDLLPPVAEMLVCFHELFPDRDALGAMLLALAALNAERGIGGCHSKADRLEILETAGAFALGIHVVIAREDRRDVDTLGTRHAVSAAGAVYLRALDNVRLDLLDEFFFFRSVISGLGFRCDAAVLFDH